MSDKSHPGSDEILAWAAGHMDGSRRYDEIEAHLSWCTTPCGEYLAISVGLVGVAMEENVASFETPPASVAYPKPEEMLRQRDAAYQIVDAPASEWASRLEEAADRTNPTFISAIADRAVYHADARPDEVLRSLAPLHATVDRSSDLQSEQARALLHLAAGIAHRTLGDHLQALRSFQEAERHVASRPVSHEYARICLARAGALRRLEQFDQAEEQLVVAGQVFGRLGLADSEGLAKVYHQLANVAWQSGNARRAFRMARKAARMFHDDRQELQTRMALDPALSALIAMGRPSPAERMLRHLEEHAHDNPHWSSRLLWKRGKLAALRGDFDDAYAALQNAAERLVELRSPLAAAQALLDLAHLAASRGDIQTQGQSASAAAQILARIPGHPADLAAAVERLHQAVSAGIGLVEVVAQLRERLQRR